MKSRLLRMVIGTAGILGVSVAPAFAQAKVDWEGFAVKGFEATVQLQKTIPTHIDCPYGKDPRQKLDIYLPPTRPASAPVFVFIHGGGFERGDRGRYGWVARPYANHGIITVVPGYRLAPEFHFPDQPDDIRRMLAWVYHNIESFGGDPARVYVGGHSAGALLTATVALKTDWLAEAGLPSDFIKGIVLVSGFYDLRDERAAPETSLARVISLYLPNPAQRTEASPILNLVNLPPRSIISVGSIEPYLPSSSGALAERIRQKGGQVELIILDGANHADTATALGDEHSRLFEAVLHMLERPARTPSER